MSYELYFGKHKGKSHEWLVFNAPWKTQLLFDSTSQGTWLWRSREEKDYFMELYRRGSHLAGTCLWCKAEPFTRMSLKWDDRSGSLISVSFHCNECDFPGVVNYARPAFFVPLMKLSWREQRIIVGAIKHQFIADGRFTQKKMEGFFRTDEYFPDATPGFFDNIDEEDGG